MELWFETTGAGAPTVVFLHAAIGDARMWEPQWQRLAPSYPLMRCDLAGFGHTGLEPGTYGHAVDVLAALDRAGIESCVIVGASIGGRVAMEVAVSRPDRVLGLVLVAASLPGHDWSPAVRAFGEAEDAFVERGEIDAAVALNIEFWLDGPDRHRARCDAATRELVADMQRLAFEHIVPRLNDTQEELLVPDLADRLTEIDVPSLVVVGDRDAPDIEEIADRIVADVSAARRHTIHGTAHLPSLEAPDEFQPRLEEFLAAFEA